jgi:hypothetical protein
VSAPRKSAAQAQAAKQKKIAIGGAVLLVGVLVIQGPKMLKMLSGGSSASTTPPPAAVAPPVTPGVAPTPTAPAATPVAATEPAGTKFISFETFDTKDPFIAQVNASSAPAQAPTSAAGPAGSKGTSGAAPSAAPAASGSQGTTGSTSGTSGSGSTTSSSTGPSFKVATNSSSASTAATATITVNSRRQVVTVDHDFPEADPVFTLESVSDKTAVIGIAGGSLKAGGKTFTLTVGTPLTLKNTATGASYKLELLSTAPSGT